MIVSRYLEDWYKIALIHGTYKKTFQESILELKWFFKYSRWNY